MDIIEGWAFIEADFQREYGINLGESISIMSWRRFTVLLQGLSRESIYIIVNSNDQEAQEQEEILDDVEAMALMNAMTI